MVQISTNVMAAIVASFILASLAAGCRYYGVRQFHGAAELVRPYVRVLCLSLVLSLAATYGWNRAFPSQVAAATTTFEAKADQSVKPPVIVIKKKVDGWDI